jgi:hypothetical protein
MYNIKSSKNSLCLVRFVIRFVTTKTICNLTRWDNCPFSKNLFFICYWKKIKNELLILLVLKNINKIWNIKVFSKFYNIGWKHGKVYIKSCRKYTKLKKRQFFMKTQESRFKFYLNFILKLVSLQLGLL